MLSYVANSHEVELNYVRPIGIDFLDIDLM